MTVAELQRLLRGVPGSTPVVLAYEPYAEWGPKADRRCVHAEFSTTEATACATGALLLPSSESSWGPQYRRVLVVLVTEGTEAVTALSARGAVKP